MTPAEHQLNKLVLPVAWDMDMAGIRHGMTVSGGEMGKPDRKVQYDLLADFMIFPENYHRQRLEALMRRLEMAIGVYEERKRNAIRDWFNPLFWIAAVIRIPVSILEFAGLISAYEEHSAIIKLYGWAIRIAFLFVLVFLAAFLAKKAGLSFPRDLLGHLSSGATAFFAAFSATGRHDYTLSSAYRAFSLKIISVPLFNLTLVFLELTKDTLVALETSAEKYRFGSPSTPWLLEVRGTVASAGLAAAFIRANTSLSMMPPIEAGVAIARIASARFSPLVANASSTSLASLACARLIARMASGIDTLVPSMRIARSKTIPSADTLCSLERTDTPVM